MVMRLKLKRTGTDEAEVLKMTSIVILKTEETQNEQRETKEELCSKLQKKRAA